MDMDDAVRILVEALRKMVGIANECREVRVIKGTVDIIKEIGRLSLEVASLIHEYAARPSLG